VADLKEVRACDRAAWRAWLERNHAASPGVWLILRKKSAGKQGLSLSDAVEEALCFGWIDGLVHAVDQTCYAVRVTPRRPGSVWSDTNRRRVARLTRAGLMTDAGLAAVRAGERSGALARATSARGTTMPVELDAALAADAEARSGFDALPPSHRRMYCAWVGEAKRAETRARRAAVTCARVKVGARPDVTLRVR
jgi:uncharacterized protein YdeI (YjbR/CyaY-like superfamily)